jgi:RND family efflux transporter MFP subunit
MGKTELRTHVADLSDLRIDERKRQGRPVGRWIATIIAIITVVVIALGAASALRSRKPEVEVAAAVAPRSAPVGALLNASGYVTPQRRATVAAKITGKVTHVFIEEGMHVTQGQVLATLDDSDYQVSMTSTKAGRDATAAATADFEVQLGNAERELGRTNKLVDAGISTPQALDAAQTLVDRLKAQIAQLKNQVQAADAKIAIDQQNIDNCQVRSPYDGIVVAKDAQPGEMVSPISAGGGFTRTGIATIVDMSSNEIEVDVNENYIARVKPGQHVTATLDAYPDWQIPAYVRAIIPTADREKGTVKVRIKFEHLDPRILPDLGVKVAFLAEEPVRERKPAAAATAPGEPVALVPQQAVRTTNGQTAVFIYHDRAIERRAVRTGAARDTNVEVLSGVAPGDLVVVKGPDNLQDGQQVDRKQ